MPDVPKLTHNIRKIKATNLRVVGYLRKTACEFMAQDENEQNYQ
jgi:hypothetical protein